MFTVARTWAEPLYYKIAAGMGIAEPDVPDLREIVPDFEKLIRGDRWAQLVNQMQSGLREWLANPPVRPATAKTGSR